jgi:hypothetical protein
LSDTSGPQPLNVELYRRLKERFGSVIIANEGVPMVTSPVPSIITGKIRNAVITAGETYRISCPFCGDNKHRLWIGYMYGQASSDNEGGSETWLANCFHNEGACLSEYSRRKDLEHRIFGFRNRSERMRVMPIQTGDWQLVEDLSSSSHPGNVVSLSQLPPDHPSRRYLVDRQYDPDDLCRKYGLGYCVQADHLFSTAHHRIILPIFMYQQLVGWQARTLGNAEPKYWNRPGMPKSRMLYNFDEAAKWPFVIVTEGATKVWRIGGPSVAIFGKSLSFYQRALIEQQWTGKPVLLLLDPDARDNMVGIVREMERLGAVKIVPIYLPEGMPAPDECDRDSICNFIRSESAAKGVQLPAWS